MSNDAAADAHALRIRLLEARRELAVARVWMREARTALEGFHTAAQQAFEGQPHGVIEQTTVRIGWRLHELAEACPLPPDDAQSSAIRVSSSAE